VIEKRGLRFQNPGRLDNEVEERRETKKGRKKLLGTLRWVLSML
jgi:hypothetical protein